MNDIQIASFIANELRLEHKKTRGITNLLCHFCLETRREEQNSEYHHSVACFDEGFSTVKFRAFRSSGSVFCILHLIKAMRSRLIFQTKSVCVYCDLYLCTLCIVGYNKRQSTYLIQPRQL